MFEFGSWILLRRILQRVKVNHRLSHSLQKILLRLRCSQAFHGLPADLRSQRSALGTPSILWNFQFSAVLRSSDFSREYRAIPSTSGCLATAGDAFAAQTNRLLHPLIPGTFSRTLASSSHISHRLSCSLHPLRRVLRLEHTLRPPPYPYPFQKVAMHSRLHLQARHSGHWSIFT